MIVTSAIAPTPTSRLEAIGPMQGLLGDRNARRRAALPLPRRRARRALSCRIRSPCWPRWIARRRRRDAALPRWRALSAPAGPRRAHAARCGTGDALLSSTKATTPIRPRCARRLAAMAQRPADGFSPPHRRARRHAGAGREADALHRGLQEAVDAAGCRSGSCLWPDDAALVRTPAPAHRQGTGRQTSAGIEAALLGRPCEPGDVVMIKGSLGTRMAPLVEALKQCCGQAAARPTAGRGRRGG